MPEQAKAQPVPRELCRRIAKEREALRALGDLLAAHARDVMQSGADLDVLAGTQLVHGHVLAAVAQLEHALREAGQDG